VRKEEEERESNSSRVNAITGNGTGVMNGKCSPSFILSFGFLMVCLLVSPAFMVLPSFSLSLCEQSFPQEHFWSLSFYECTTLCFGSFLVISSSSSSLILTTKHIYTSFFVLVSTASFFRIHFFKSLLYTYDHALSPSFPPSLPPSLATTPYNYTNASARSSFPSPRE